MEKLLHEIARLYLQKMRGIKAWDLLRKHETNVVKLIIFHDKPCSKNERIVVNGFQKYCTVLKTKNDEYERKRRLQIRAYMCFVKSGEYLKNNSIELIVVKIFLSQAFDDKRSSFFFFTHLQSFGRQKPFSPPRDEYIYIIEVRKLKSARKERGKSFGRGWKKK